jgi:hypothetical protein
MALSHTVLSGRLMNLESIISDLSKMIEPNRRADRTIAMALGMREESTGGASCWVLGERRFNRVPAFTASVDAAMIAAESACPLNLGACTFGGMSSRAALNEGPPFEGGTPAIAICMAALKHLSDRAL